MHADEGQKPSPDRELWLLSRDADAPEDEAARLLDLAAFADGALDEDDGERIAAWLAAHPDEMSDVAAARALAVAPLAAAPLADAPAEVIARASAAHPSLAPAPAEIVTFPAVHRQAANWNGLARWGSLAAAVVVAGWLGFNLGIEAWSDYSQIGQGRDDPMRELLDPSAGVIRDLTDSTQS
jgi:hypothetical protein